MNTRILKIPVNDLQEIINSLNRATRSQKEFGVLRFAVPEEPISVVQKTFAPVAGVNMNYLTFKYDYRNDYWYLEL